MLANIFKISFFLLIVSITNLVIAQQKDCNCFVHGEVIDTETKQPIAGAIVLIKENKKGTTTDSKGHYHIDKLCHGKYTVISRIVGYKETYFTIDLNHNQEHEQDFSLKEDDLHLDHIEIRAEKIENQTQSKRVLDGQMLDQTRGESLGESLKQISGVTTLQTGSSIAKPVIHGMHSNRVLIMNNGVRQEGQQWGSEHAPEIDPFVAKKVTVVRGASGVRYGSDAIAGVVLVEPQNLPDSAKITGEVNSVYFANGRQGVMSAILQGGFNKIEGLGWRIQGTIKRGGDISTPNYRLINTGIAEQNFSIATGYRFKRFNSEVFFSQFNSKIGIFAGSHIGSITDLTEAIKRGSPLEAYTPDKFSYTIDRPYQDIQHNLLKLKSQYSFVNGNKLSLTLGRQYNFRKEIDVLRGDRNLAQTFLLTTYTGELLFEHKPIFKIINGTLGSSAIYQQNISTGSSIEAPRSSTVLIPNFRNFSGGIFIIERFVKEKYQIEGGLRYDFRDLNTFYIPRGQQRTATTNVQNQNFSGTFGVTYNINAKLNAILNIASAWRAPTVNELFSDGVHHGAASFEKGNPNLSPEVATNASFTVNYKLQNLETEVHFYYNSIKDFIFLSPTGRPILTIRGAFPEFNYTQTNATFRGFDVTNNWQILKNLSLNSKFAYLEARDIKNDQWLIMIPANRLENGLRFEVPKWKSSFAISNLYVAQQTRVPTKVIFDIPQNEIIFAENGGDFAPPPPAYSIWNINQNSKFSLNHLNFNINLSVNNVFNTRYRDYLNRFRYFTDEMGRNFAIKLKLEF
ncbi:MAG: TonB-dependent receptor [Spirosomaceae bacterium]|jgi:iron complex outermembrane receptor protein|nr:TonB-dependent receptor [Spirosomataceae bacterium]